MTGPGYLPFVAASLLIELTPGPNMAYLTLLSAQHGRRAGLACTAGVASGLFIIGALSVLGVSTLVAQNAVIYETIRWAGVAFLFWLAFDTWRDTGVAAGVPSPVDIMRESFQRGLITNLLNPKAFLFYIAILPTFIPTGTAYSQQAWTLTLLYVLIATAIHFGIVLAASRVTHVFDVAERRKRIGQVFSILLLLIAVWIAFSTARAI